MKLHEQKNNFDFVRLIAAILVIIGHSGLSGQEKTEYIGLIFGVNAIHDTAVCVFFSISGYLITKSYFTNPNAIQYLKKRVLRIIPALVFSCILTFIIVGIFYSNISFKEHLRTNYGYMLNSFLFVDNYFMPNVFTTNHDSGYINRSLWTLKYEFTMYIVIMFLGLLRILKSQTIYILNLLLLILFIALGHPSIQNNHLLLNLYTFPLLKYSYMFFCGSAYFFLIKNINQKNIRIFLFLFITYFLLRILMPSGTIRILVLEIILPFLTLSFCTLNIPLLSQTSKYGDFSYGIFLWSYPVQQALVYHFSKEFEDKNLYLFSFFSLIITLIFAIISWHLIEAPALKLKNR